MPNFRIAPYLPTPDFQSTPTTPEETAAWSRIYHGATIRLNVPIRHQAWFVVPRRMQDSDWDLLHGTMGRDDIRGINEITEHQELVNQREVFAVRPVPIRAKYIKHNEIEPLPLPG